jgi:hypothetical protein
MTLTFSSALIEFEMTRLLYTNVAGLPAIIILTTFPVTTNRLVTNFGNTMMQLTLSSFVIRVMLWPVWLARSIPGITSIIWSGFNVVELLLVWEWCAVLYLWHFWQAPILMVCSHIGLSIMQDATLTMLNSSCLLRFWQKFNLKCWPLTCHISFELQKLQKKSSESHFFACGIKGA